MQSLLASVREAPVGKKQLYFTENRKITSGSQTSRAFSKCRSPSTAENLGINSRGLTKVFNFLKKMAMNGSANYNG